MLPRQRASTMRNLLTSGTDDYNAGAHYPEDNAHGSLDPGQAGFTGTKTMRRMSEPVQRSVFDTEPVTSGIRGGGDGVIMELERQAAEMEQMRRQHDATVADAPSDAANDVDAMYINSMLETDPEKVIRALVAYFKAQRQ